MIVVGIVPRRGKTLVALARSRGCIFVRPFKGTAICRLSLAVLKAKIKIKHPRVRAGVGPKPTIALGKWQSGPSPGTPRGREGPRQKIKNILSTSRPKLEFNPYRTNVTPVPVWCRSLYELDGSQTLLVTCCQKKAGNLQNNALISESLRG